MKNDLCKFAFPSVAGSSVLETLRLTLLASLSSSFAEILWYLMLESQVSSEARFAL